MPTPIVDVDEWTAPIEGPADSDVQAAAAYLVGYQGLANRTEHLRARVAELEDYVAPALGSSQGAYFSALRATPSWDASAGEPSWLPDAPSPSVRSVSMVAQSTAAALTLAIMGGELGTDITITEVRVCVTPAAARSAGVRMEAYVASVAGSGTVTPGAEVADDGTASRQLIVVPADIRMLGTDSSVYPVGTPVGALIVIKAANATAPVGDRVHFIEVRFTRAAI